MKPAKCSPLDAAISRASAIASAGVSTPARLRPVSHSTTTESGRPEAAAACGRSAITIGLSAATVMLALRLQRGEARHLLLAEQIVADQDVVDAGIHHHLGLADLLAGDALGAGRDLHLRQHRALVGLDVRPVGDAGRIARRLDARDVALDPVHVDDGAGRAVFAGDFGGEGVVMVSCVRIPSGPTFAECALGLFYFFPEDFQFQPSILGRRQFICALAMAAEASSNFLRSLA